jgi:hypothetical protein
MVNPYFDSIHLRTNSEHVKNCQVFLDFNFLAAKQSGNRLLVTTKIVAGKGFQVLKEINVSELGWKQRLKFWITGQTNIKKIGQFVETNVKSWPIKDEPETIKLETQYAILARKCARAGYQIENPFKKTLKIAVSFFNGLKQQEDVFEVSYDRLTTKSELTACFGEILAKPITIFVPIRKGNEAEAHLALQTLPSTIFKNIVCTPATIIDPAKERPGSKENKVIFFCHDLDESVKNQLIWDRGSTEGKNQVLSEEFRLDLTEKNRMDFVKFFEPEIKKLIPTFTLIQN